MWGFLQGTSGYTLQGWPPRGPAVRTVASDVCEKQAGREPASKLARLRKLMAKHRVGILLVMEQDEHNSEYVADRDRRIRFISGFAGSAGFVSIGLDWAELATDSRYHIIAEKQLSREWSLRKLGLPGVAPWEDAVIERAAAAGVDVGVDARFISSSLALRLSEALQRKHRRLVPLSENLVDLVWGEDQPELPRAKVKARPLELTGEPASSKLAWVRREMACEDVKSFVFYALDEIAWLLNLRGNDVPYTPVFKSFLIVTKSKVVLYSDESKLPDLRHHEGITVLTRPYKQFFTDVSSVSQPSWVPGGGSWAIMRSLKAGDTRTQFSPVNLRKAIKNSAEIQGAREAQIKCSASIVKYLAWLEKHIDDGIDEYAGGEQLRAIRETLPGFKGNSFETISSVGENAAAPHYAPQQGNCATITREKIYLLDSGSQFLEGSTDITRTVHYGSPSNEEKRAYTLVLKGQLSVSSAVFPEGTSGSKLDILARQFLWEEGLDYGHGTGHGIGSYLSIHELPLGIGMSSGPESTLQPGHFVSDEPGYYKAGSFGVRLENDILVVPANTKERFNDRNYWTFEILTLVPYDQNLIDASLLTQKEKNIIDAYHAKCRETLAHYMANEDEWAWLRKQTKPLN